MTHRKNNSLVHILELDLGPFVVQAYVSPALEFSVPVGQRLNNGDKI